tara:strand:+ start:5848 stop:6975 length:1128 start_codon:yes stop_codon:yes gene_type:complete
MARQLFYGKLSNYTVFANGTNSFIRIRGDFSTTSQTITNVVNVAGYEGLEVMQVGQLLIGSSVMPNATAITAIDVDNNTITVSAFPSANGTNSLARISTPEGTYFFRSSSIIDPQGLINFQNITGSNDAEFSSGDVEYAILGQASNGSTNVVGRFHKYNITDVVYRNGANTQGSFYVSWGEPGTESDTPDVLSTSATITPVVSVTTNEGLAPLFSKTGIANITDLPAGSDAAAWQISAQYFLDDLSTSIFYTGSAVTTDARNINFVGDGVTVTLSGSSGVSVNIPGGGVGSAFPYTGSAKITGSLEVIGFTNLTGSTFIKGAASQDALAVSISSGNKKFSINSEGVAVFNSMLTEPTAVGGGIYYSSSQFFFGVE